MRNVNNKPVAHVIIGFIGAGKTTFAKKLEQETKAIRITKDEWIIRVFGNDPTIKDFDKYDESITHLAQEIAIEFLKAGKDVILDEGFWVKSQREEIRKKIENAGAKVQFYYLKTPEKVLKDRVLNRNNNLMTKESFLINEEMFDKYKKYFEEPTSKEEYILIENK